jgi:hypothetical protein
VRFAEGLVGGDGDAVLLLVLGQDLEEQFGAVPVEFHVVGAGHVRRVGALVDSTAVVSPLHRRTTTVSLPDTALLK